MSTKQIHYIYMVDLMENVVKIFIHFQLVKKKSIDCDSIDIFFFIANKKWSLIKQRNDCIDCPALSEHTVELVDNDKLIFFGKNYWLR
jgi:hypothetical protein